MLAGLSARAPRDSRGHILTTFLWCERGANHGAKLAQTFTGPPRIAYTASDWWCQS
jgi:hypothetical protein